MLWTTRCPAATRKSPYLEPNGVLSTDQRVGHECSVTSHVGVSIEFIRFSDRRVTAVNMADFSLTEQENKKTASV